MADPAGESTGGVRARFRPPSDAAISRSLTSLREKPIKIGAKVVSHVRYIAFQMPEMGAALSAKRRTKFNATQK